MRPKVVVLLCLLALPLALRADTIEFTNQIFINGAGFGNQFTILSLHNNGTETGSITPAGTTGDATNQSAIMTKADLNTLGITSANQFGLLFNVNQQGSDLLLNDVAFTLYFYDSNGNVLFTAAYTAGASFGGVGQGTAGYLFRLNGTDFDTYFNQIAKIGMWGSATNGNDGADNWAVVKMPTNPVPEPASLTLFGTGVLAALGVLRRRLL